MISDLRRCLWPKDLGGKATAVVVYACLLLVLVWFAALASAQRRLAAALDEARRLGYRETWEELAGPAIPDAENAAFPMIEVSKLAHDFHEENQAAVRLSNAKTDWPTSAKALASSSEYERLLNDADRRPRYRTRIRSEDFRTTNTTRLAEISCGHMTFVAEAEFTIAMDRIANGRPSEAVERVLRLLRITRKWIANDPFFPSHNVAVSVRANCFACLNAAIRGGLPTDLQDEIEKELALQDRVTQESVLAANGVRNPHLAMTRGATLHRYQWARPFALVDEALVHEDVNDYVRTIDEAFATYSARPKLRHPLGGLPGLWIPPSASNGLNGAQREFDGSIARARCLRIVNAMAKRNDFNAEVTSLGLPAACLVDPMNGEQLRVKPTPEGPIVYSVGGDLNDDGGHIDAFKAPYDVGWGPVKKNPAP